MSTIKASKFQHPDSEGKNIELDSSGNASFSGEIKASSIRHPNSSNSQITMNIDGTVNVSGLSVNDEDIQDTISQTKLSSEKELTPDLNDEYTLGLEDAGKVLTLDDADENKVVTVNIPNDSQADFEVGSTVKLYRDNEAGITIKANESVSIKSPLAPGPYYFVRKYGEPQLRKRAANQWVLTENGLLIQSLLAVGGNEVFEEIINGAVYRIHVFTTVGSSQAFEVELGGGEVEYLVVAGGGGGGMVNTGSVGSAGGGAGGYRCSVKGELSGGNNQAEPPLVVEKGSYTVTVGAGGVKGVTTNNPGGDGGDSTLGSVVSLGGGGGGGTGHGRNGGSGGGGGYGGGSAGSGTSSQGFDGGGGSTEAVAPGSAGGGGGASEPGIKPATASSAGGNGGDGIESNITGLPTYRAGGGGGGQNNSAWGSGGLGGGADAGNGNSGENNTGGGGGGTRSGLANPGQGGSGIVIVRYRIG